MAHRSTYQTRAQFRDMEAARRAIAALERAGVPASDIGLEGGLADKAAGQADTSHSDEAFMHEAEKTVFGGAAIGTGVGALVGLLAGLVFVGWSWPGIAVTVAAGGAAGGGLGFVVNAMASMQQTDAAELTYHDVDDGELYVVVRTEDREDVRRAAARLRESGALSVEDGDEAP